jgi:hypothetical protein
MARTSPLHITNGDADANKVGEILGEDTLPWRDFLHDGPVRPGLLLEELSLVRARFISGLGYGSYDSIQVAFQNRDACFMEALEQREVTAGSKKTCMTSSSCCKSFTTATTRQPASRSFWCNIRNSLVSIQLRSARFTHSDAPYPKNK